MRRSLPAIVVILALAAAPAFALDGLAPAGPCAGDESPVTGPVALMFSPYDVASDNAPPSVAVNPPIANSFQARDACDTPGGCGGLNERLPINPPVNPPGGGGAPGGGNSSTP